jgi:hypothetical protein
VPAPCSNEMQGIKQQLVEHNSLVLRVWTTKLTVQESN